MNFRILGPLEVFDDEGRPLVLGKRLERALLALLVIHAGQVVSTDQLIDGLWPSGPPARVDASLHSIVARLRRSLAPDRPSGGPHPRLIRRAPGYLLVADDSEIDARRFEAEARQGHGLLASGDFQAAYTHLEAARAAWQGPALAEFAYQPFAEREAARLEELRLEAAEDLLGARLGCGDTQLVPELEAQVAAYPMREHFWEYLLVALYRDGRHADALRRAHELSATLAEVGLSPSPRVVAIESAILRHDADLLAPIASGSVEPPHDTVESGPHGGTGMPTLPRWWQREHDFVGRSCELEFISAQWRASCEKEVHYVAVLGEPGIGKTSVAMRAANAAHDAGAVVVAGRCSREPALPYESFVEALGRLVETLTGEDIRALGRSAGRLSQLLPAQRPLLGGSDAESDSGTTDVDRYLMFEAVVDLLARQAARSPVVIVLDDLQWADEATMKLLDHVLRSDRSSRLLVIATIRETDLRARPGPTTMLDTWIKAHLCETLELGGLSARDIGELLVASGSNGERADVAQSLLDITGGNPFFLVEMARSSTDLAALVDNVEVPGSVQALVRSRLVHMLPETVRLLTTAAVAGRRIDSDLLARASPAVEVGPCLDEATRNGLLVEHGHTLVFRHDLVRATLVTLVGPAARAALHRAIGRALVDRARPYLQPIADELAHHFVAAAFDGDPIDAVTYSQLAGDAAVARLAYDTAVARFEAGLAALESSGVVDPTVELRLRLSLAEAWRLTGELGRAGAVTLSALPLVLAWGDTGTRRRAAWLSVHGVVGASTGDAARLMNDLEVLGDLVDADSDAGRDDEVAVLLARSSAASAAEQAELAVELNDRALRLISPECSSATVVWAVDQQLIVGGERSSIAERLANVEMMLAAVEQSGDTEVRLLAYSTARWAFFTAGQVARAFELVRTLDGLVLALGMPRYLAGVAQRRAMLEILQGRFAEAERHAIEVLQHRSDAEFFEGYVAHLALIRCDQGRSDELLAAIGSMEENDAPSWLAGRALALAEVGDYSGAHELVGRIVRNLPDLERDMNWLGTLSLAVRAAYVIGAVEFAEPLLDELVPHSGRIAMAGPGAVAFGPVDVLLGQLHTLLGHLVEAENYFEGADDLIAQLSAEAVRSRRELVHAELLVDFASPARRDEALRHVREAVAIIEHLGIGGTAAVRAAKLVGELS